MTSWLVCPQRQVQPKLRLFCFAYAGGSAWIFRPWAKHLPESVEVCAIELPGRGKRLIEAPVSDLSSLIQSLGPQILPSLDLPFAFFGHSLGALIAFELCRWLRHTSDISPAHFWASAASAPHLPAGSSHNSQTASPLMHTLPEADFINKLKHYQGTPSSVLNNAELMDIILPTLRADFTLLETYQYQSRDPLNVPVTGLWGNQDTVVSKAEVAAWQVHTPHFKLEAIAGDHFFIQQPLFVQKLLPTLRQLLH
ncbi:MAG: alpha/beta fold hydrolase [Cyanobacteria bacterium P01_F01_bin.53]